MQTLPGGNSLVGYGGVPAISEYAADGALLFDAHQPYDMSFYRAFRFPWSARPTSPPAVLASLNDTAKRRSCTRAGTAPPPSPSWRVLAGEHAGVAEGAGATIPVGGFRDLDDAAAQVRLRGRAGAGRAPGACSPPRTTVAPIGYYASLRSARGSG